MWIREEEQWAGKAVNQQRSHLQTPSESSSNGFSSPPLIFAGPLSPLPLSLFFLSHGISKNPMAIIRPMIQPGKSWPSRINPAVAGSGPYLLTSLAETNRRLWISPPFSCKLREYHNPLLIITRVTYFISEPWIFKYYGVPLHVRKPQRRGSKKIL